MSDEGADTDLIKAIHGYIFFAGLILFELKSLNMQLYIILSHLQGFTHKIVASLSI